MLLISPLIVFPLTDSTSTWLSFSKIAGDALMEHARDTASLRPKASATSGEEAKICFTVAVSMVPSWFLQIIPTKPLHVFLLKFESELNLYCSAWGGLQKIRDCLADIVGDSPAVTFFGVFSWINSMHCALILCRVAVGLSFVSLKQKSFLVFQIFHSVWNILASRFGLRWEKSL